MFIEQAGSVMHQSDALPTEDAEQVGFGGGIQTGTDARRCSPSQNDRRAGMQRLRARRAKVTARSIVRVAFALVRATRIRGAGLRHVFLRWIETDLTFGLILIAAAIAASYFAAMALAPAFPGTVCVDPEFAAATKRPLRLAPQQLVTYVLCGFTALAILVAAAV